jgi:hypothetical protein
MRCLLMRWIDVMDARILRAQRILDVVSWVAIAAGAILIGWLI